MRSPNARIPLATSLMAVLLLAACTDDEPEPQHPDVADLLLSDQAVTGVISSRYLDDLETLTTCGPIARADRRLETFGRHAIREVTVESSVGTTTVLVAAFTGLDQAARDTMVFASLELGLEVCTRDAPVVRGEVSEWMSPLSGLPDGAIGYSSSIIDAGAPEVVARAYAVGGDGTVVVVSGRHIGDGELGVDVTALLAAALEKIQGG